MRYLILLLIVILASCASFNSADRLYQDSKIFVREGKPDFAFMSFNELLRQSPDYRHAQEVKFAIAEYYYDRGDYKNSLREFVNFIKVYKTSKLTVFAKAFLYKIINDVEWMQSSDAVSVAQEIKKEFFSKPAFFVFSEFKEKKMVSLLSNKYILKEYVDKIDIFRNDKIFLSVSS